jgi:AcrR family transcriptional regulator
MEEVRSTRKERERQRQRQEIMEAALYLFSTKGYHNVSMQEVAQKAEFSVGTIYNFFESKYDLYREILRDYAYKFHDVISDALEKAQDEIGALKSYLRAKLKLFKDNVSLIRLYVRETQGVRLNPKAGMEEDIRMLYSSFIQRLASIFEMGIKKGIFRSILTPKQLAIVLEAVSNALLFEWFENPDSNSYPEDENEILRLLFEPLLTNGGYHVMSS